MAYKLWGFGAILAGEVSTNIVMPVNTTKGFTTYAQHASTGNVTRTFAVAFAKSNLTVYMDSAPASNTGFYWLVVAA